MTPRRALLLALLGLGCDDPSGPPRPPRTPPRSPERPVALRNPGAPPVEGVGEGPGPTDDDAVARCVRRNREALGAELGHALQALGDDSLLQDACGLELAVRDRAPARCASLHLSGLRETCSFRTAVVAGRPDACPAAVGLRGRDPVCVALAARDPALCGAASLTERARCLALASGGDRPCQALDALLRPGCARDLDVLRPLLAPMPRVDVLAPEASRNVWSSPAEDGGGAEAPVAWLTRGVFLDESGSLWLMDPGAGWPGPYATAADQPLLGAVVPARRGPATPLDAALVVAGSPRLSTGDGTLHASALLTHAVRRRGGRVAGRLTLEGAVAGRAVHVELRFDTFVRDVVAAAALR